VIKTKLFGNLTGKKLNTLYLESDKKLIAHGCEYEERVFTYSDDELPLVCLKFQKNG
jgi:hypothetical protein